MEEKKTTPDNADQNTNAEAQETPKAEKGSNFFTMGSLSSMLSEKEQKSLLFYIAVGIILVEFAVTVGALISGIAGAEQLGNGKVQFNFPWTGYLVTVVVAPIIVILLVNLIGMGFYRAVHGEPAMSAEQFDKMPEKARNLFSLVRGAPTIILFGGIVLLGAVLYYLDGVMSLLLKLGDSVETIVIWGTCGLVLAWCLSYCARMWLMYRTRRLEEDYAFRREVLERTGMVILDGKNMLGSQEGTQYIVERALPSGGQGGPVVDALPASDTSKSEAEVVTPEAHVVTPHADNEILDAEIIEPVKSVVETVEPVIETVEPVAEVITPEAVAPELAPEPPVVETIVAEAEAVVEPTVEPTIEAEPELPAEDAPADITEPAVEVEAMAEPETVVEDAVVEEAVAAVVEVVAEPIVDPTPEADPTPSAVHIVHVAVNALFDSKEAVPATEEVPSVVEEVTPIAEESILVAEEPASIAEETTLQATDLVEETLVAPEPIECAPMDFVQAEPEAVHEAVVAPAPTVEVASTPEPSPVLEVAPSVNKPNAPQSPQAPQAPNHAKPKPPVRRARLSDKQKRRS